MSNTRMSEFPEFEIDRFYAALDSFRGTRSVSWRQMAREAGVSPSTLTRIGQGRRPDVDSLVRLCEYAQLDPRSFSTTESKPDRDTNLPEIMSLLRSDPHLTGDDAEVLSTIVRAAYDRMKSGDGS